MIGNHVFDVLFISLEPEILKPYDELIHHVRYFVDDFISILLELLDAVLYLRFDYLVNFLMKVFNFQKVVTAWMVDKVAVTLSIIAYNTILRACLLAAVLICRLII